MTSDKFWLLDPTRLLTDFKLMPTESMTLDEKLNAFTTIIFIITIVMILCDNKYWYVFLGLGLLIVFAMKIILDKKQEGFTIPPTYIEGAEPMTTVPPLFAEEWQSPSPVYEEFSNSVNEGKCGEYIEDRPVFGQYISSSRLFPYQDAQIKNMPLNDAQLFMNDEWTRDSLSFRNDISRTYINRLDRLYRNNCYDSISPFNSC